MSFWSSQTIRKRGAEEKIIEPFDDSKVKESAYSLSVGDEIFITSASDDKFDKVQKIKTEDNIHFIPPGQFAYILTEENLHIPNNCLAFISMKFKIKAQGLINVSGFHVDPGYQGKLIFAVYNAGVQEIGLRKGDEIFLIWFSELDDIDSEPRKKLGIKEIESDIIGNAKNAETLKNVSDKLRELEKEINISSLKSTLILSVLVPFNFWFIKIIYEEVIKKSQFTPASAISWMGGIIIIISIILIYHVKISTFFAKKSIKHSNEKNRAIQKILVENEINLKQ